MVYQEQQETVFPPDSLQEEFDYSYVPHIARIAVYDNFKAAPHIIEIQPAPTPTFIENLASQINEQRILLGGEIPYSIIREVTENFIHAKFQEIVVSIYDKGNTIRFCDQGPGIANREKALKPGYTSAKEPMKKYIRGVGSGFPIVKDYLDYSHGTINIEDNIENGAIITISLVQNSPTPIKQTIPLPPLNAREKEALAFFAEEGAVGNKELCDYLHIAGSSANSILKKLEEYGLIEMTYRKKRILTDLGSAVSKQI